MRIEITFLMACTFLMIVAILNVFSLVKVDATNLSNQTVLTSINDTNATTYEFSTEPGKVINGTFVFNGKEIPITYERIGNESVFEGDILLYNTQDPAKGAASSFASDLWNTNEIGFKVDPNIPDQYRIQQGIEIWDKAQTGFEFVPMDSSNEYLFPNYIYFKYTDENNCSSPIGMIGGGQPLYVSDSDGCSGGNIAHELGHALGLWHEQTRSDRDQYVIIMDENIIPGKEHNFEQVRCDPFGNNCESPQDIGNYDYCSFMHYPQTAFGKLIWDSSINDARPASTIVPVEEVSCEMGQRERLSEGDINAIKELYPQLDSYTNQVGNSQRECDIFSEDCTSEFGNSQRECDIFSEDCTSEFGNSQRECNFGFSDDCDDSLFALDSRSSHVNKTSGNNSSR